MRDLATRRWWRRGSTSRREGAAAQAQPALLERARGRLLAASVIFLLCFGALVVRTLDVAVIGAPVDISTAGDASAFDPAARADIVDRNGVLLASNLPTHALYVEPGKIFDREEAVAALGRLFPDLDPERTASLIASGKKSALLRHDLTPEQAHAINRLGIPGLWLERQEQRVYPQGRLFAHAVGFTDVDNRGLAGVEKAADAELRRRAQAHSGPLALSLDIRVQHALAQALQDTMTAHRALGAAGMVMDVETGELLALVSLPSFDPKAPDRSPAETLFNRATLGTYELGSTFKPFTVAAALDLGVAGIEDSYDATEPIRVSRYLIRDHHPENRWLTVPEILIHSSNIGAARMAVEVGAERQRAFLDALGMFERMPLETSERGRPLAPRRWSEHTTMTVSYGHGLAVTPLHLLANYAALVNGGIAVTPTLLKREPGEQLRAAAGHQRGDLRRHADAALRRGGRGHRQECRGSRLPGGWQDRHRREGHRRQIQARQHDHQLRGRLSHRPAPLRGAHDDGRAQGDQGDLRLRDGRLDRSAGRRRRHRAHRAASRRAGHRGAR